MTADQVIRYKQGKTQDQALLMYSLMRSANLIKTGGVLFTTETGYCYYVTGETRVIFDMQTRNSVAHCRGMILMAFDEESSFSIVTGHGQIKPVWMEDLSITYGIR